MRKKISTVVAFLMVMISVSQNTTIELKEKKTNTPSTSGGGKAKLLIIPFEPKLYMSEIDRYVAEENDMTSKEIKTYFRFHLDMNLWIQLKKNFSTISLLADSIKSKPDLEFTYSSIGYTFEPLPMRDATGMRVPNSGKPTASSNNKSKIQGGQLVVQTSNERKFTNTKINNPKLLASLGQRYSAEYFLFINELDIKRSMTMQGPGVGQEFPRVITVHYTLFNRSGKVVDNGLVEVAFPLEENNPKKISDNYFGQISAQISRNIDFALNPVAAPTRQLFNNEKK